MSKMLEKFKKGDKLKVKILEINVEKERISLGIKQLEMILSRIFKQTSY